MAQTWLTPPINAPVTLSNQTSVGSATGTGTISTAGYGLQFWNNDGDTTFAGNIVDNSAARTTGLDAIGADKLTLSGTIDVKLFSVQNGGTILSGSNRLTGADTTLNVNSQLTLGGDETVFAITGTGVINGAPTSTLTIKEGAFYGVITGGDSFTLDKVSSGNLYLYGANTFTGLTTIHGGELGLITGGSLASKFVSVGAGSVLSLYSTTAEQLSDQASVELGANSDFRISGTERIQSLSGVASSGVQVGPGNTLYVSGTVGGTEFAGDIRGPGGLTIDGTAGRMTLSGSNSFTGPLNAFGGVLTLTGSVATKTINIGDSANTVNPHGFLIVSGAGDHIADDAQVRITGNPPVSSAVFQVNTDETVGSVTVTRGEVSGTGKLTATTYNLNDGAAVSAKLGTGRLYALGACEISGTADVSRITVGDNMVADSGHLTLNGTNLLTAAPVVQLYTNGQLDLLGDETIGALSGAAGLLSLGNHTLTIDQSEALSGTNFGGVITGTGGLVKKGVGHMATAGDLTYTGATDVQAGQFNVVGSLASTQITVGDGALLGVGKVDNIGSGKGLAAATVLTINGGAEGGVSFMNIDDTIAELHGTSGSLGIAVSANDKSASLSVTKGEFGGKVISPEGYCTLIKKGTVGDVLTLTGTGSDVYFTRVDGGTLRLSGGTYTSHITVGEDGVLEDTTADGVLGAESTLTLNAGHASIVKDTIVQIDGDGTLDVGDTLTTTRGNFSGVISGGALSVVREDAIDDTLTLSGANTYINATTLLRANLILTGSLQSASISLDDDSFFEDRNGGLADTAQLTNNGGRILLGAAETVGNFYNNGGTLDGTGKVLTVTSAAQLGAGSVINANLNATGATGLQVLGNTTLNGRSLGSLVSVADGVTLTTGTGNGHFAETTALTLGAGSRLSLGGSELLATVADTATSRIDLGDRTLALGGNSTIRGTIAGTAASRLTVLGNLTVDSAQLTYGVLDGSGTITAASFTNKAGGTVKGTLHFTGAFTDNGILAPGNSPGTIVIGGNYTEAGTLQPELGGTAAGSYDQVRIGGSSTIGAGATLAVQTYNNVQPARGDVYQVIANASGNALRSSGTFAHVTFDADGAAGSGAAVENAAVLFDVNTGRVLATGLNASGSTFNQLAVQASQQSFVDTLFTVAQVAPRQIDSATVPGILAYTVITAPTLAERAIDYFTPTVYSGMAGVAALGDDALARFALNGDKKAGQSTGPTTFFAGSLLQKGDAADESDLRRNDYYVGGEYAFNASTNAGLIVAKSDGKVRSDLGRDDADGVTGIAYASKRLGDFAVSATVGYGVMDHDLDRPTLLGAVSASGDTRTWLGGLGASYTGLRFGAVSVVPSAQLLYTHTKTDGFVETGAADALANDGSVSKSFTGRLGTAVRWSTLLGGRAFSIEGSAAVDHAFSDDLGGIDARFVGTPAFRYSIEYPENKRTAAVVGAGIGYDITEKSTLSIGGEVRLGDQSSRQLNCTYRFAF